MTYCMARELGTVDVHKHVGMEPSGRAFNEFVLNTDGLPHNPMVNAGAIMVASIVEPDKEPATRFAAVRRFYERMAGHKSDVRFDNDVYLSEKHHADRNISLAYYMRENNAFAEYPTPSQLQGHLDLYFQCCSLQVDCEAAAVMAATLANSGVCPVTCEEVVKASTVRDTLSLMYMCGMYDYSGQFAFEIGLPAKSGVSGCLLLVIPNVGGAAWSPRLDSIERRARCGVLRALKQLSDNRHRLFAGLIAQRPTDGEAEGNGTEQEGGELANTVHRRRPDSRSAA